MIALKLKMPLAGPVNHELGEVVDFPEADAIRMVLRGVAVCHGKDEAAAKAARDKLLAGLSAEEQAQIISGRVVVTSKKGLPVYATDGQGERLRDAAGNKVKDPSGARIWADADGNPLYRYQTRADRQPRRPKTMRERIKSAAKRLQQRKPFGPPKEAPAAK